MCRAFAPLAFLLSLPGPVLGVDRALDVFAPPPTQEALLPAVEASLGAVGGLGPPGLLLFAALALSRVPVTPVALLGVLPLLA